MPPKGIKEKEEYFNSPSSVLHQRHGDSTVDRVLEDDSINNQIFLWSLIIPTWVWVPVIASFSKSLFSQWVKAVPSSPWSSNSAPDSLSQPKCFRTCANKIWSNSQSWDPTSSRTLGVTTTSTSLVLRPVLISGLLQVIKMLTTANFFEEYRTCEQLDISSPSEWSSHSTGAFAVPRSDAVSRCPPLELVVHRPEVDYYRLSVR